MKTILLKSKPGSFFRIGDGSLNDVSFIIHSDTLFSAITNIYELVYNEGEEFVKLVENGKIKSSSAFPVLENVPQNKFIYFLPKPLLNIKTSSLESKKEKKIKFFSLGALEQIIKNLDPNSFDLIVDFSSFEIIDEKFCCLKSEVILDNIPKEKRFFIKEIISPKTAVHKEKQEDSFYFQTDLQLIPLADKENKVKYLPHFYFLIEHSLSILELKKFTSCLRILADEGIGGDRSAGKGKIEEIVMMDLNTELTNQENLFLNLSTFNPKNQSEFDNCISYDIIKRGGGDLGSEGDEDNHRKQVRMITEGSVIKNKVEGRILDVSPFVNFYNHKIYRNGKAFLIPIG